MKDWAEKLDTFLEFNEYDLLNDSGKIQSKVAKKFAEGEYSKFRVIQDRNYESDFDKMVNKVRIGDIPKEDSPRIPKPPIPEPNDGNAS